MGFGAQAQVFKPGQNEAKNLVPRSCLCAEGLRALILGLISVLLGTERGLMLASGLPHTGEHVGLGSRKPHAPQEGTWTVPEQTGLLGARRKGLRSQREGLTSAQPTEIPSGWGPSHSHDLRTVQLLKRLGQHDTPGCRRLRRNARN